MTPFRAADAVFPVDLRRLHDTGARAAALRACTREIPASWRPLSAGHERASTPAWSSAEARDAQEAVQKGLDELRAFYASRPSAIASPWQRRRGIAD